MTKLFKKNAKRDAYQFLPVNNDNLISLAISNSIISASFNSTLVHNLLRLHVAFCKRSILCELRSLYLKNAED